MNGRYTKRIRKEINRTNRCNADLFMDSISILPLRQRIHFCFDILFKVYVRAKAKQKRAGGSHNTKANH